MLYLTTGANGTGKTLFTLKQVHEQALKEARPVCYNGRFDMNPGGPLTYWKRIDAKDWQAEPDGTIFVFDECHNDFPVRPPTAPVPGYVQMLAEHRKRGFDFYLMTQHPQNIDLFVRRLIANPGWHAHLKRIAGAQIVSRIQWDAVNGQCEKPGSGATGQVTTVPYPKEVYSWYTSASLHTGKVKIPRAVYVLGVCAVAVPLLLWGGYRAVMKTGDKAGASATAQTVAGPVAQSSQQAAKLTAAEYVESRAPRLPGLAYSAPAYDAVTQPKEAPYPAACIEGRKPGRKESQCECFTQQGTRLPMELALCSQIVRNGFFLDWLDRGGKADKPASEPQKVATAAPEAPGPTWISIGGKAAPAAAPASVGAVAASEAGYDGSMVGAMRGRGRLP